MGVGSERIGGRRQHAAHAGHDTHDVRRMVGGDDDDAGASLQRRRGGLRRVCPQNITKVWF
jgi:hypothetical protein